MNLTSMVFDVFGDVFLSSSHVCSQMIAQLLSLSATYDDCWSIFDSKAH